MKRNSAYFIGTIVSIIGISSNAQFDQCNFNNNNGIKGGLFYVSRRSSIQVSNSILFSNFAVNSAIAYIENSGSISIDNCDISFNQVITVGLMEIVDSVIPSSISKSQIYSNMLVSKNVTIKEIDDPTI